MTQATEATSKRTEAAPHRVCVVGVGGGALRIVDRFRGECSFDVRILGVDTDARELERYPEMETLRIGKSIVRGLGCGGDPELGKLAAQSDRPRLAEAFRESDLILLVGCLGKGCATGALPEIAGILGENRIPSLAILSLPFEFEGKQPSKLSRNAILSVRKALDGVIELPNDLLFQEAGDEDRADQLFAASDEWVFRALSAIIGPFFRPGLMSVDLATFRSALQSAECRVLFAVARVPSEASPDAILKSLLDCPLLAAGAERLEADRLLVSIGSSGELTTDRFAELTYALPEAFHARRQTVFGLWTDSSLGRELEVSLFARTHLDREPGSVSANEKTPVHDSKLTGRKSRKPKERQQVEFDGLLEHNERGAFSRVDVEPYGDTDLDKPTFLRRGIKIQLPKH